MTRLSKLYVEALSHDTTLLLHYVLLKVNEIKLCLRFYFASLSKTTEMNRQSCQTIVYKAADKIL